MHKVLITDFARESFNRIIEYYRLKAGPKVADTLKAQIKKELLKLKDPKIDFQEDDHLKPLAKNHRRMVCGNYLIIYYRSHQERITYVTDIFDARQYPKKEKA